MQIEEALVDHWRRDEGMASLLDPALDLVRGTAPPEAGDLRLYYSVQSDAPGQSLAGGETADRVARIRLECVAVGLSGYARARGLADAVKTSVGGGTLQLRRFRGWLPTGAPAGQQVWVQAVRVEEVEAEQAEESPGGDWSPNIYTVSLDLAVSYLGQ